GSGTTRVTHVYQQDGLQRTTSVCEEINSTTLITANPCGLDLDGNVNGVITSYFYDALDRPTRISQGSLLDRLFTYDGTSNVLSEVIPEAGGSGSTLTTTYSYNSEGLLATRTRPSANQSSACVSGNTCATTTTTYNYDALHRPTHHTYSGS